MMYSKQCLDFFIKIWLMKDSWNIPLRKLIKNQFPGKFR